jgi:hypothetical protein
VVRKSLAQANFDLTHEGSNRAEATVSRMLAINFFVGSRSRFLGHGPTPFPEPRHVGRWGAACHCCVAVAHSLIGCCLPQSKQPVTAN